MTHYASQWVFCNQVINWVGAIARQELKPGNKFYGSLDYAKRAAKVWGFEEDTLAFRLSSITAYHAIEDYQEKHGPLLTSPHGIITLPSSR